MTDIPCCELSAWILQALCGRIRQPSGECRVKQAFSRLVVFHMGSGKGQLFRRWLLERFIELAAAITREARGVTIALTGQPFEKPLIERFIRESSAAALDASELDSIEKASALLQRSDLVVSNDIGVMHLAAAMGAPTVGIFGPDSPKRDAPVGPRSVAAYEGRVLCSPCNDIYQLRVPAQCSHPEEIRCLYDVVSIKCFNRQDMSSSSHG